MQSLHPTPSAQRKARLAPQLEASPQLEAIPIHHLKCQGPNSDTTDDSLPLPRLLLTVSGGTGVTMVQISSPAATPKPGLSKLQLENLSPNCGLNKRLNKVGTTPVK